MWLPWHLTSYQFCGHFSELYRTSGVRTCVQKVTEFEELLDVNPSPLRGQRSYRNTYTIQIKESTIEIFNFAVFKTMKAMLITELTTLRPLRPLKLKC